MRHMGVRGLSRVSRFLLPVPALFPILLPSPVGPAGGTGLWSGCTVQLMLCDRRRGNKNRLALVSNKAIYFQKLTESHCRGLTYFYSECHCSGCPRPEPPFQVHSHKLSLGGSRLKWRWPPGGSRGVPRGLGDGRVLDGCLGRCPSLGMDGPADMCICRSWSCPARGHVCHRVLSVVVWPLSLVWLFATPWTAAHPASLSLSVSWSLLKLMSILSTMLSWLMIDIQLSHPLSPSFPPAFNLFQHYCLLQWVNSSHQVAKGLELQLQHQSFQWIFRVDFL